MSTPNVWPDWITPELIADTIETWSPLYGYDLTQDEAVEIIMDMCRVLDVVIKE